MSGSVKGVIQGCGKCRFRLGVGPLSPCCKRHSLLALCDCRSCYDNINSDYCCCDIWCIVLDEVSQGGYVFC